MQSHNNSSTCRRCHHYHHLLLIAITALFHIRNCAAFAPNHAFGTTSSSTFTFTTDTDTSFTTTTTKTRIDAATLDNSSSQFQMSDFEKRMRQRVMQDDRKLKRQRQQSRHIRAGAPKNLLKVKTLEDFKRVVGNQKDQIVVVRWYAPWCKACKAIAPSYYRLATKFPNTLFVDIPVTPENANLHQGLGVPSLPYGHIYHPTGKLVEELKISRKYFPHFARTLMTYIEGRCKVDYDGDGVPFLKGNSKVSGKEKEDNNSTSSSSTSTVS